MKAEIHAPDLMRRLTVDIHVTGMAEYRVRLLLGVLIMRLAVFVLGCNVNITGTSNDPLAPEYDDLGLPIRLDVNHQEWDWHNPFNFEVFLDGVLQSELTAFDRDAGWVERYRLRDGKPYVDGDQIAMERVCGIVTVRRKQA